MKLFTAGPVEIEKEVLEIGAKPSQYMRTAEYSEKWNRIFENLKYIFQTKNTVLCFSSSGTGAMEASITNFFSAGDTVLYINAGSFGKRWGDIAKKYGLNAIELKVEFGNSPSPGDIKDILEQNPDIKGVFATLNETSCGSLQNIEGIGKVLKKYKECLFVVDCISGLCSDKFLMDDWNADVAISASQKALALPPGLSFMALNDKAIDYAKKSKLTSFYFDIFDYLENAKRGQTPFTPATGIVEQLDYRLQKIKEEGLDNFQQRYRKITDYLREGMKQQGFETFAQNPANCVSGFKTNNYNAEKLIQILRNKFDIEVAPSGGELRTSFFRVGVYGNIGYDDVDNFLHCMSLALVNCRDTNNT